MTREERIAKRRGQSTTVDAFLDKHRLWREVAAALPGLCYAAVLTSTTGCRTKPHPTLDQLDRRRR